MQTLFDHADNEPPANERSATRAGCRRSTTTSEIAHGYGTRRTEAAMLDAAGFGPNPDGPEFGDYDVCYIRQTSQQAPTPNVEHR